MVESGTAALGIAGYSDVERIGQGGVGVVYRATRHSTGGTVAIKVLRDVSDESVVWHRTRRELTALVALAGHANVIQLVEQVELDHDGERVPALVMEYAPGGSVADLMARRDDVATVAEVVLIGEHVAAALVAAHAQGIVHRDIKPQNLLIDAFGQVKLCDFGIASLTRTEGFVTRTSAWSMRYSSPEDLDEEAEVGPPSDIYSLGATLLHLLHGAPPTLKQRLVEWVPPHTEDGQLAALDVVLAECLRPAPDRRPTASELLERFEQLGWTLDARRRSIVTESNSAESSSPEEPLRVDPARDETNRIVGQPGMPERCAPVPVEEAASGGAGGSPDLSPVSLSDGGAWRDFDMSSGSPTDETLLRGGRQVPTRPTAVSTVDRRWPTVVAGLAVAAVLCIATIVLWPGGSSERSSSVGSVPTPAPTEPMAAPVSRSASPGSLPAVTVDTRPPETTVAVQAVAVEAIQPGLSLTVADRPGGLVDIADQRVVWPFGDVGECLVQTETSLELLPVSCAEPHDLQRVLVTELDPAAFPPAAGFDRSAVQGAVVQVCHEAAEQFVGSTLVGTGFELPVTRPSAETWELGDRRFQCLLGVPHQRIVGDAGLSGD